MNYFKIIDYTNQNNGNVQESFGRYNFFTERKQDKNSYKM